MTSPLWSYFVLFLRMCCKLGSFSGLEQAADPSRTLHQREENDDRGAKQAKIQAESLAHEIEAKIVIEQKLAHAFKNIGGRQAPG